MKYITDALGLKFIHWEFEKLNTPITNIEPSMKIIHVVKPGTKIKNGLLFRYTVKIYQSGKLTLNCIAEEVFINDGISSFSFNEVKNLIEFAFNRFNFEFERKIKSEGHPGASIIYSVKDDEVFQVLRRISEQ